MRHLIVMALLGSFVTFSSAAELYAQERRRARTWWHPTVVRGKASQGRGPATSVAARGPKTKTAGAKATGRAGRVSATRTSTSRNAAAVPTTSGLVSANAAADAADITSSASGRVRTLGAWLDDASMLALGEAWLALSMSKWDMPVATDGDALGEKLGFGRTRLDLSGTASYAIAPALAVFGSLGRTIFGLHDDGTRLLASVGLAVNLK